MSTAFFSHSPLTRFTVYGTLSSMGKGQFKWTMEQYLEYRRRTGLGAKDNCERSAPGPDPDPAPQAPNVEPPACRPHLGEKAHKGLPSFSRVRLRVISYRHRLADADGISAKAVIDGIVHAGILADDNTKIVEEISWRQVKIESEEEERTEVQFFSLE